MFGRYLVVDLVAPDRRGRDREKIAVRRPSRHFLAAGVDDGHLVGP
jgi:hypothetical protein